MKNKTATAAACAEDLPVTTATWIIAAVSFLLVLVTVVSLSVHFDSTR